MSFPRPIHPMSVIGTRSPYESFWDASRREAAAAKTQPPVTAQARRFSAPIVTPAQKEPTRTDVMSILAKKTTKEVREWFREQIEGLDESSSD